MIKFCSSCAGIALLASLILYGCSTEKSTDSVSMDLLVGTYTSGSSQGIYHFKFDPGTGEVTGGELMVKTSNPSYLTISDDRRFIYAVNEDERGRVTAFTWDQTNNSLVENGQTSSQGIHPCYIDENADGSLLAVANYSSGTLSVIEIKDGDMSGRTYIMQNTGSGPNQDRQEGPHVHCAVFSRGNLYAVDLGTDEIIFYAIDSGRVGTRKTAFKADPGDGPRHLVFSQDMSLAFLMNELSNTVVSLKAEVDGTLSEISKVSSLPTDFLEHSQAADIHLSQDGRFLYTTNRGHDSIAIFSVSETGELEFLGTESTRGEWPRNLTISPGGEYLLVANQYSGNIVVFAIDETTGELEYQSEVKLDSPVCLKF